MIRAYYNDHDKNVCAWLEQLIRNGDITKGDVDDRSITEVTPSDIAGYDRVHFFAGIGTWDYALNRAGWGDRPIWTASLPCQPFSAAGKGRGKEDERHLLPAYLDLVKKCRPNVQIGEQVERAIGHGWLDDLQAVMEAEGYAIGHCVLGAHSVNAAHIRQRLYWVANTIGDSHRREIAGVCREAESDEAKNRADIIKSGESRRAGCNVSVWLGDSERTGLEGHAWHENSVCEQGRNGPESAGSVAEAGCDCGLANTENQRCESEQNQQTPGILSQAHEKKESIVGSGSLCSASIEWLYCRDNKYRPVKPGIFPLAHGATGKLVHSSDTSTQIEANSTQEARAMRLKGYGNAIQADTAIAFIRAFMSV